jgi:hypothetical protein
MWQQYEAAELNFPIGTQVDESNFFINFDERTRSLCLKQKSKFLYQAVTT